MTKTAADLGAWLHDLDLRRAGRVVAVPGGAAVLHDGFPDAHDHNKLSLVTPAPAAGILAAAERVLGGAGRAHRLVTFRTAPGDDVPRRMTEVGYERADELVMVLARRATRPRPPVEVTRLSSRQRIDAAVAQWSQGLPAAAPDVWRQLGERITTVCAAADTTFLGVLDDAGQVVARADVYVHGGVAQVEEVVTAEAHRGRGIATALVLDAVAHAQRAGAGTVFLVADADDWPRVLYERLGFVAAAVLPSFSRASPVP